MKRKQSQTHSVRLAEKSLNMRLSPPLTNTDRNCNRAMAQISSRARPLNSAKTIIYNNRIHSSGSPTRVFCSLLMGVAPHSKFHVFTLFRHHHVAQYRMQRLALEQNVIKRGRQGHVDAHL